MNGSDYILQNSLTRVTQQGVGPTAGVRQRTLHHRLELSSSVAPPKVAAPSESDDHRVIAARLPLQIEDPYAKPGLLSGFVFFPNAGQSLVFSSLSSFRILFAIAKRLSASLRWIRRRGSGGSQSPHNPGIFLYEIHVWQLLFQLDEGTQVIRDRSQHLQKCALASGYKSSRFNWLKIASDFSWEWTRPKACKMGTFSNRVRLSTCRIS